MSSGKCLISHLTGWPAIRRLENMDLAICLPTYNEADNLPAMHAALRNIAPEALLVVIDDASPDGTGDLADRLASRDPRLKVLHRPRKEGLGQAYRAAFIWLLHGSAATAGCDLYIRGERPPVSPALILQMDADFSHPVSSIPALLAAARDADLVIGSRHIAGGGIARWGRGRRLLSRWGSAYARLWTGMPVRDCTAGFKLWRRDLLAAVLAHPLMSNGYAFQIETSYLAWRLGGRLREVPIVFTDRRGGKSKMSLRIALEAMLVVPALRWRYRRLVNVS
ncbi:MAG: polyprenol monophosphomannose synthase [Planctomycetota bacterium]|nr:polyprenol monophosphomannose synthase [Planctomycetota bacterium]